jgi:arginase
MSARTTPKVAVFGVPSAAGATAPGSERAAFALREAGLLEALKSTGARVVNLSDLSLFPWRDDPEHPRLRNAELVECAIRATSDEMTRALAEGFTIVLGGDCSLVAGAVSGERKALGGTVGLVHVDANADLNTPQTSPSGRLAGMSLAIAIGHGPQTLTQAGGPAPAVAAGDVALLGYRELDPGEDRLLEELGLAVAADDVRRLGAGHVASEALGAVGNGVDPVVVHFDVDVLDPAVMPAKSALTPGRGLDWAEAEELLLALCASPRVVALEVCEFNPAQDPGGASARRLVELLTAATRTRLGR